MEGKGSFLDPSFSPTMEILRGISMGAQFLLTLPHRLLHFFTFYSVWGGEEDLLVKHRFSQILSLKSCLRSPQRSLSTNL